MARKKRKSERNVAEQFANLTKGIDDEDAKKGAWMMSPEAMELLAFDFVQRHRLAEFRAWLHTDEARRALELAEQEASSKASCTARKKTASRKPQASSGLTAEQQKMAKRMERRQSGSKKKAADKNETSPTGKKKKSRRRKKKKGS